MVTIELLGENSNKQRFNLFWLNIEQWATITVLVECILKTQEPQEVNPILWENKFKEKRNLAKKKKKGHCFIFWETFYFPKNPVFFLVVNLAFFVIKNQLINPVLTGYITCKVFFIDQTRMSSGSVFFFLFELTGSVRS